MKRIVQLIFTFFCFFCVSGLAMAEDNSSPRGVFALGGSQSFTSQILGDVSRNGGFSGFLRGGFRYDVWGMFMELQYVGWTGYSELEKSRQGSLNAGIGAEWLYFDHRLRTAISAGASVLATKAPPDPAGTVGVYLDIVPAGYVIRPWSHMNIVITPLSLFFNVPSLKGIPLLVIQYRTVLTIEFMP